MQTVSQANSSGMWWQNAVLSGLAIGLPRHRGSLGRVSLPKLLANPPSQVADAIVPLRALIGRTASVALDSSLPMGDRIAAIELMGYQPLEQSSATYEKLLGNSQPVDVQLACVEAMQNVTNDNVAKIVIDSWSELGPRVRLPALGLLLRRNKTTRHALEAMRTGLINPAIVDIDMRVQLLQHRDSSIKALAEHVFGAVVAADRREVAKQYMAALTMKASATEGIKVFDRVCAKCHRINGRGHEVGPDISDVQNRSREALL